MTHLADATPQALARALTRADELDAALMRAVDADHYRPYGDSHRLAVCLSAANTALEHGRALRVLVADGLPTAALSLMRLQHEALTRALWLLYAADDAHISKLSAPLTKDAEVAASKLPMMADMLKQLSSNPKAAKALVGLLAFKANNAAALNSFVHGGIHALQRHAQGYPVPLIVGALRNSNGLMLMAGMVLAILSGRQPLMEAVNHLSVAFANDLPPHIPDQEHQPSPPCDPYASRKN